MGSPGTWGHPWAGTAALRSLQLLLGLQGPGILHQLPELCRAQAASAQRAFRPVPRQQRAGEGIPGVCTDEHTNTEVQVEITTGSKVLLHLGIWDTPAENPGSSFPTEQQNSACLEFILTCAEHPHIKGPSPTSK